MSILNLFQYFTTPFEILLFWTPSGQWLAILTLLARIIAFGLLLRTYIVPWLFLRFSRHIRIRSISLRSIRGLYISRGNGTWGIERLSYSWSRVDGARHLTIKVEGLTGEISKNELEPSITKGHKRSMTAVAISAAQQQFWPAVSAGIVAILDPMLRPLIRGTVTYILRGVIYWIPSITSAVLFDIYPIKLKFTGSLEYEITAEKLHLHTLLDFRQGQNTNNNGMEDKARPLRSKNSFGMAAWKSRLTGSFERTWDRAIETREGVANFAVEIHDIKGSLPSGDFFHRIVLLDVSFFRLPGAVTLHSTTTFDPKRRRLHTHALQTNIKFEGCFVDVNALHTLLQAFKNSRPVVSPPKTDTPFFSPTLSFVSQRASFLRSPRSPLSADSTFSSIYSPTSPILESITVSRLTIPFQSSILPRRHGYRPCMKLKDTKNKALISFLDSIRLHISSVSLSASPNDSLDPYRLVVENVNITGGLSKVEGNILHRRLTGRNGFKEPFDSDVYFLDMTIHGIWLTRSSVRPQSRLINVGPLCLNIATTQWPSPLLVTSPFLGGDPNAPAVLLKLDVECVDITERLDVLLELAENVPEKHESLSPAPSSFSLIPVPRIEVEVNCGPIQSQLIVGPSQRPHTIEMRTDGFSLSVNSHFDNRYPLVASTLAEFDMLLLRMIFDLSFFWRPTFIRIRTRDSKQPDIVTDYSEDPALVSLDAIEITGRGEALAEIRDDTQNTPSIDISTLVSDVVCCSDAMCLELWHPEVLDALVELLEVLPSTVKQEQNKPFRSALPLGCNASVSLARFVVLVTASELNPNDNLELSRGFALRVNGMSAQYCALHSTHLQRYKEPTDRAKSRLELYLPKERSIAAWEEAKRIAPVSTFIGISFSRLSLRSAISTQYSTDDPFIAERDDKAFENRDCLQMHAFSTDARIDGRSGQEICDVMVKVPYVQANLRVADVYSIMLGTRTLKTLLAARPQSKASVNTQHLGESLPFSFQLTATIGNMQAHMVLRNSKIFCRLDSLTTRLPSTGPWTVGWEKITLWTRVPVAVNRWQQRTGQKWEEFLALQKWNVHLDHQPALHKSVSVKGDAARFRIPFGFILADLILDVSVVVKALRHLHLITTSGFFSPLPKPEAEGAKAVPHLSIQLGYLSLEAADDPLESKLGRIFRVGFDAAKNRMDREDAFTVKVNNILEDQGAHVPERNVNWEFSSHHSVSIRDARDRLDRVHVLDWVMRLEQLKDEQIEAQAELFRRLRPSPITRGINIPTIIPCTPVNEDPPLVRITITNLALTVSRPIFPLERTPDFLFEQGQLPKDTQYSLLIPLHLRYSLSSLQVTLRDYPLAMVDIPTQSDPTLAALDFDTDLVIAEEMGTDLSIDWVECPVIQPENEYLDVEPFYLMIPKTIMPVKTYANPEVKVSTPNPTTFCWGVSYGPATQDLMRIIDTLSSSPRDPSPPVGFWDKLRLVFHWSVRTSFRGDVRLHMKGLRDPYEIIGVGAGFLYSWKGHTKLLIGRKNDDGELIQVISDSMLIAIPNLKKLPAKYPSTYKKICAKFLSGIKFGLGFSLERSCGSGCHSCSGSPFHRQCRFFDFKPHYMVMLEKKPGTPDLNGPDDSYSDFRSDFIHLSISLAASTRSLKPGTETQCSSLHLTPKTFTYFWSWWTLFDGVLSLPIRHGSYFPRRIISPKIGRHLATLKYRLLVPKLFVMHGYLDDSRETWVDGVTPWVGIKAMIENFQVDMHQRDQEMTVAGTSTSSTKVIRRKAFYAAEMIMKNLDLRSLVAIFKEPLKQAVGISAPPQKSSYRAREDLPIIDLSSSWYNMDDLVETDWSTSTEPTLHILPVASCPRISYYKKNTALVDNQMERSKFGKEHTHQCLLGGEPSVPHIQMTLASERIDQLNAAKDDSTFEVFIHFSYQRSTDTNSMILLLQRYINHLLDTEAGQVQDAASYNYSMPADSVSADEWAEFDNVFQIHCPKLFVDSAIRDIMMQYYHCSRDRRGFEYHMATRAVKFIRDQAEAIMATQASDELGDQKSQNPAHVAATALRKIVGEAFKSGSDSAKAHVNKAETTADLDPMDGWSEGVSLRKSHCCLLLKPQIVLRNRGEADETCVVAALQAKLQSFAIMDDANADDPVTGKVMTRTYAVLSGMQTFAPTFKIDSGDGCVPLEVLIDLRCESDAFERLVPQTDASFKYDKFNRLRLHNSVASAVARKSSESTGSLEVANHLHDQTDLIQVQIPRFTVTASDHHFETISNIITRLLLYSDAAHKTRLDHLETVLFQYDFTDLSSSAEVIYDLQNQMRKALDVEYLTQRNSRPGEEEESQLELMRLRAHMFLLAERLNFLFEAIKLAQDRRDRRDERTDRKSATLLHASSSEISWRMVDEDRDLLAKLAVQNIDFYWLRRQDSSTVNHLTVGDLQAYDGSRDATWAEILSKHDEPAYHPLFKRGLFVLSNWSVLPPVGGITIYESFEISLHPLRLQIDAKVGRRIMEYVYPARKHRRKSIEDVSQQETVMDNAMRSSSFGLLDGPLSNPTGSRDPLDTDSLNLAPPLRKLGASRSFTDLRSTAAQDTTQVVLRPTLQRTRSSEYLKRNQTLVDGFERELPKRQRTISHANRQNGDAAEMKTRSSRKTFVFVKISSLHLLLSVMKEDAFVCRDARIRTRDLEFRNQTLSFEELVNQFIPSDMSWKGWVKMAFQQPLVPVLPVARELISKTKWIASKSTAAVIEHTSPQKSAHPKAIANTPYNTDNNEAEKEPETRPSFSSFLDGPPPNLKTSPPSRHWKKTSHRKVDAGSMFGAGPLTADPEPIENDEEFGVGVSRPLGRKRVLSLFSRTSSKSTKSETSIRVCPYVL
ncbi:golgi-body localization protein domain-containing protein [Lentinula aff. detonsa]|nr:golgi-body localization protein domain-containing protein [Lentinula aff. detonsa]